MTVVTEVPKDGLIDLPLVPGKKPERIPATRGVALVIFSEDLSEVVLFRYGPNARIAEGIVGLPAGRLKNGESHLDAAKREGEQETGIRFDPNSLHELPQGLCYGDIPLKSGEKDMTRWKTYVVTSSEDLTGENNEGQAFWYPYADVEKFYEAEKKGEKLPDTPPFLLITTTLVVKGRKFMEERRR